MIGVTISNKLSVSDHVTNDISNCSPTLYALTVLHAHGLCDEVLQSIYRSLVIDRLLYASSAWWGFMSSDQQQIAAFIRKEFTVVSLLLTYLAWLIPSDLG